MHKKKILYKIILFMFMFLICITCMSKIALADNTDVNQFENSGSTSLDNAASEIMGIGIGVVQVVAAGVSIIVLLILGIKYVSASPEGRASYKKVAILYVLGLTLVVYSDEIIGWIGDLIN